MDGKKFPLVKGGNLFYVLYKDLGLELINVIALKVLGSERDDRALGRREKDQQNNDAYNIPGFFARRVQ